MLQTDRQTEWCTEALTCEQDTHTHRDRADLSQPHSPSISSPSPPAAWSRRSGRLWPRTCPSGACAAASETPADPTEPPEHTSRGQGSRARKGRWRDSQPVSQSDRQWLSMVYLPSPVRTAPRSCSSPCPAPARTARSLCRTQQPLHRRAQHSRAVTQRIHCSTAQQSRYTACGGQITCPSGAVGAPSAQPDTHNRYTS